MTQGQRDNSLLQQLIMVLEKISAKCQYSYTLCSFGNNLIGVVVKITEVQRKSENTGELVPSH